MEDRRICYTIGYGNSIFNEFLNRLLDNSVKIVIDVRSYPQSQRLEFNAENLKMKLPENEIVYYHYPLLGGRGKRSYIEYMKSADFMKGFADLLYQIKRSADNDTKIALMCAEKNPRNCHRRHIAERLEKEGIKVMHLTETGQESLTF
ncbi:DUF488 domain-containing protein [Methanohalophilus mahii]|uniref:DUF488 domain-containing protein n=1 Tax=Methanohalophilus mahii (strain ATCC 35705 / DSM 5219 / SLP) TaxID=547558 RepID=D5EAA1_METMS|nr:DUF488 domain-containing protein [Methanohalophilus mahii]ADE36102.1 protein of unknown function DUF1130 [Methanohalophilus mahii DSM 5219]